MSETLSWILRVRDDGSTAIYKFKSELEELDDATKKSDANFKKWMKTGKSVADGADKGASAFQKWTGKIALGNTALVHLGGVVQQSAGALKALSGVAGLVPGAIAEAGVTAAVAKLAFAGFGTAISETDPKKLTADLKNLAPATAATAKEVRGLKPAFTDLRKSVSQNFFSVIKDDVGSLGRQYLPTLKTSLSGVGTELGYVAHGFLNWAKQPAVMKKVNDIIGSTSDGIGKLEGPLFDVANIILNIVDASTNAWKKTGGGLVDVTDKADKFVSEFTDNGKGGAFAKWVKTGEDSLKSLGGILATTGRIIGDLFSAKGGDGSGLAGLNNDLKKVQTTVEGPAFQTGLKSFFGEMEKGSKAVDKALPPVMKALERLAPDIGKLVGASSVSFGSSLKTYARLAIALAPAIDGVTKVLVALAPVLGVIAPLVFGGAKAFKAFNALPESLQKGLLKVGKAMIFVDGTMDVNPIFLVVAGLAALTAGLVYAYKHSETFRDIMNGVFKVVATVALTYVSAIIHVFGDLAGVLGHLPGKAGAPFRAMQAAARNAEGTIKNLQATVNRLPTHKTLTYDVVTNIKASTGHYGGGHALGARASGGPVRAGVPYIVGEKRPEVFVPSTAGTILPRVPNQPVKRSAWSSAGGGDVNVYVSGGTIIGSSAEFRKTVVDALNQGTRRGAKVNV